MYQPLQPQFKIRLYPRGYRPSSGESFAAKGLSYSSSSFDKYMDIEECVSYPVTLKEGADMLNTLSFTVNKHADVILQRCYLGMWVVMYGGYYSPDGSGVRKVFSGTITRIKTSFPDNGAISFNVECMSYGYNQLGKDTYKSYVYPDKGSERGFAKGKSELSLEQLVRGIAEDNKFKIGEIALPKQSAKMKFTLTRPRYQKNVSDWGFLLQLASSYGCSVWIDMENGQEYLYFVDVSRAKNVINDRITFVFPLKSEKIENATESSPADRSVKSLQGSEIQTFPDSTWNRPRLLRSVTVDEDISLATAVVRSSTNIDPVDGTIKEVVTEIGEEDGRRVIYQYELDEARVEYIHRTDPKLADDLRNQGLANWKWSSGCKIEDEDPHYARYYYKLVKRVEADVAVFDQSFFGISISATVNQDLDIKTQRSYSIRGISRYNTSGNTDRYFLRELTHVWDSDGTRTELDFIR